MFELKLPIMLKKYGPDYEKWHTKQGIQNNRSLKEESYVDWLPKWHRMNNSPFTFFSPCITYRFL